MKKIIPTTIISFCLSFCAKAVPQITSFVAGRLTTENKLLISSSNSTNVTCTIQVSRPIVTGTTTYEGVNMQVYVYFSSGGVEEQLSGPYDILTADFNNTPAVTRTYNVTVGANKVGSVFIKYYYTNVSTGQYVGPTNTGVYETTLTGTLGVDSREGYLNCDTNTDKVYWFFDGIWRYIQSPLTLNGLFDQNYWTKPGGHMTHTIGFSGPQGLPLGPNNGLRLYTATGEIFFIEETTIRHFTTWASYTRYHFNGNALISVNSIAGLQVGPPIY